MKDGVVYLTSGHEIDAFREECWRRGSCHPLWRFSCHCFLSAPPTVHGGLVYVPATNDQIYAFPVSCRRDGGTCSPRWTARTEELWPPSASGHYPLARPASSSRFGDSLYSPIALAGDLAIVSAMTEIGARPEDTPGKVYAFPARCPPSPSNCAPAWRSPLTTGDSAPPTVVGGRVYVATQRRLWVFDHSCGTHGGTCQPLWSGAPHITDGPRGIHGPPVIVGDRVFVVSGPEMGADSGPPELDVFDRSCRVGTTCRPEWFAPLVGYYATQPVVAGEDVYVATDSSLYSFPVACGIGGRACRPAWSRRLHDFLRGPTLAGGHLFVSNFGGALFAFRPGCSDADGCSPLWHFRGAGRNESAPIAAGGRLYLTAGPGLYAFDPSCSRACHPAGTWVFPRPVTSITVAARVLYVRAGSGLYAFPA